MRLNEIDKSTFKNKLRYEWLDELQTRVKNFNMTTAGESGWRVDLYADENPIRIVLSRVDGNSTLHTMEIWMAQLVLSPLATDYSVDFKEVDREPRAITKYPNVTYVALPRVTEAKISKDEFKQRLVDPLRAKAQDHIKQTMKELGEHGWEAINVDCFDDYCRIVYRNKEARDWVIWGYENHLKQSVIPHLQRLDKNGTWDARPNSNRTIEVYVG